MKTHILLFILLLTSILLIGCTHQQELTKITSQENVYSGTCPYELIDDTYPGKCGQYIDDDQNKICDRSE